MEEKISICGIICSECPRYIATKDNDIEQLKSLAELWFATGARDSILTADEMKCNGCSKDIQCVYNINSCEYLENINNCGECTFFPCDKINLVFERSDSRKEIYRKICSPSQFKLFEHVFFRKKEILTEINMSVKF